MKFQVGDNVGNVHDNVRGTIVSIDKESSFPYRVKWDDGFITDHTSYSLV